MTILSNDKSAHNFVVNLSVQEIEEIKNDILLKRKKYDFFYAIDTYDIISHFLPYTDGDLLNSNNKNIIAQKAVAYEKFFSTLSNSKLILLNEYKTELLAAKSHIVRQIKNSSFLNNNIEKIREEISKIREGNVVEKERFRQNIELVIFLLILSENKNNVQNNFFEFLKTKLSLFSFKTENNQRDEILDNIFANCQPSEKVTDIYDLFFERTAYALSKLDTDLERYTYLENSFRDIEVIDRLNSINAEICDKQQDTKVFFVYLSSAPFKSKEIISVCKKYQEASSSRERNYFGSYNFHRNIFQCFLYKVLMEEFPDDNDPTPLVILESIKLVLSQREELMKRKKLSESVWLSDGNLRLLNDILDRYSSNIDNHFYFKIYNKYQAVFDLDKQYVDEEIGKTLKEIHVYLKSERILADGQDIFFNINQYKQTYFLAKLMTHSISDANMRIPFGQDIVRDSFHHLPYLLFIDNNLGTDITGEIYSLFTSITEVASPVNTGLSKIAPQVNNLLTKVSVDVNNITNMAIRTLVTAYLYLITDVPNNLEEGKVARPQNKELEIIDVLKKQKRMIESSALNYIPTDDGKRLEIVKKDIIVAKEFDYIILWLLRRNKRYTEAIDLGNELVSSSDDARFYHGLALAYISQAYEYILDPNGSNSNIDASINFFEYGTVWMRRAKESYLNLMEKITDDAAIFLVSKNLMATLNSLADSAIRIFSLTLPSSSQLLEDAMENIRAIKAVCGYRNVDYDKLSIYNFTETEILYFKAFQLTEQEELAQAYNTVNAAKAKYYVANSIKSSMHDKFKSIITNINSLASEIFAKRGTF